MAKAPFPIIPELTGIAIAYRNRKLIGDQVLPRVTPVSKEEFKYFKYDLSLGFTVPDTKVGRKGELNEVEFPSTDETASTSDHGLKVTIPQKDIDNAPPGIDPRGKSVEFIMDLVALDREIRVANMIFNPATYPDNNKMTLAGASQFSDPNSDPIRIINDALDACITRPNKMCAGRLGFSALARHPKIVSACLRNPGQSGIARREEIAALFELDEVIVGESFLNINRPGQAASLARVWGKHIALLYLNPMAEPKLGVTFGMTVPYGTPIAAAKYDEKIGLRGGERVWAGESVCELVTCPDVAYFLQDVAA
ncbi:MAG: phage capsid protein [Desulfovibrionaceae bacterium]|nr:phage capsid protein [Desulfovibrionaceae bacterium]MBF0513633.1 phage capsid protein [Desulfovibrionaceae bacterium]